jgi:hypothetical protein
MLYVIAFLWELPQTILALCLINYFGGIKAKLRYKNSWLIFTNKDYIHRGSLGVSLGRFILLSDKHLHNDKVISHEYGHSIQSLIFGWVYLLVIGFFSYGNNFIWRKLWAGKRDYYDLFPERWADILGKTDNRKNRY